MPSWPIGSHDTPANSSNTFDQVSGEWLWFLPEDEEWAEESPSMGGKALRHGIDLLLTDGRLRLSARPITGLTALEALRWMERSLDLERALLIAQARFEGASWTDVARRIGVTKQAAHHRYGRVVEVLIDLSTSGKAAYEEYLDYLDANFEAWPEDPYGDEDGVSQEG